MAAILADFIEAHEGNVVMLGNLAPLPDPTNPNEPATKHYTDTHSVNGAGYVTDIFTIDLSTDDAANIWQNVAGVQHAIMCCTRVGLSVCLQIYADSAVAANTGTQIMAAAGTIPADYRPNADHTISSVLIADDGVQIPAYVKVFDDGSFLIQVYGITLLQAGHTISFHTLCFGYNMYAYLSDIAP